jgi:hypothetical protein
MAPAKQVRKETTVPKSKAKSKGKAPAASVASLLKTKKATHSGAAPAKTDTIADDTVLNDGNAADDGLAGVTGSAADKDGTAEYAGTDEVCIGGDDVRSGEDGEDHIRSGEFVEGTGVRTPLADAGDDTGSTPVPVPLAADGNGTIGSGEHGDDKDRSGQFADDNDCTLDRAPLADARDDQDRAPVPVPSAEAGGLPVADGNGTIGSGEPCDDENRGGQFVDDKGVTSVLGPVAEAGCLLVADGNGTIGSGEPCDDENRRGQFVDDKGVTSVLGPVAEAGCLLVADGDGTIGSGELGDVDATVSGEHGDVTVSEVQGSGGDHGDASSETLPPVKRLRLCDILDDEDSAW